MPILTLFSKPTAARRAFPCWDEPLLKATYTVTMISRADTVNLSNMPAVSEVIIERGVNDPIDFIDILASTKNEEWKITRFDTTPLMSSYLVAFANGHFEFLETSVVMPLSGKTVPLRIYSKVLCHLCPSWCWWRCSDLRCDSSGSVRAWRQSGCVALVWKGV